MNGFHTTACDSCTNEIVHSSALPSAVYNLYVTIPTDDAETYEDREYHLCTDCRRQIVDFIDGMDESETRADTVALEQAERVLSETADDYQDLSNRIGDLARGETDADSDTTEGP